MTSLSEEQRGAAGEIRTPEVRHHWISNPAQWPGYATAAAILRPELLS